MLWHSPREYLHQIRLMRHYVRRRVPMRTRAHRGLRTTHALVLPPRRSRMPASSHHRPIAFRNIGAKLPDYHVIVLRDFDLLQGPTFARPMQRVKLQRAMLSRENAATG